MSERKLDSPQRESQSFQVQRKTYTKSKTIQDINRKINIENNSQKVRTLCRTSNFLQINQDSENLFSKTNLDTKRHDQQHNMNEKDFNLTGHNIDSHLQHENDAFQKSEMFIQIIKKIKLKKYINAFLQLSRIRLYKNLNQKQFMQINDLSTFQQGDYSDQQQQSSNSDYKFFAFQMIKRISIPIFQPHNYFINIWQMLKIISISICYFFYLVAFAVNININNLFDIRILFFCQLCLVIDIFVTINTGIYIKGVLCTKRQEIFNYYRSSTTFYCDICSVFFTSLYYLIHFCSIQQNRAVLILLLPIVFKLNDFYVIIKKIKFRFQFDRKMQNCIELINLIKNIIFISHIFACIWLRIGIISQDLFESSQQNSSSSMNVQKGNQSFYSWIDLMNLGDSEWYVLYLYSYYYITVTMSTVGYGDIRPTNLLEVAVCVFLIITCCIMFGFTLNSIGEIFQEFFTKEKLIQEKRYIIANYMDKNQIDASTRKSIFEYLEYYWKESIDENLQEENKIIQQLSDNLKEELLIQSNKLILKESKVLKENFSPEILAKCISIIKEQKLTPGETLIQQDEGNIDCSIYFVLFGELEIYNKQKLKQKGRNSNQLGFIAHLKRGESFGEKSFFSGNSECLNVRSKSFSKILKIRREDFIQLLKDEKEQYEKFIYLQDKLIFSNDISQLNQKCKSCQSNYHEVDRCPHIHFIPRKLKIIGVNQISCPQERKSQYKRSGKKQGTLENSPYNTQALLDYLENQLDDIEAYEQQYFQYSFFKQKSRQFQIEDDDFDVYKIYQEGMRSRQFTNDISESPFVGQLEKKKTQQCFKKKVGLVFQSPTNNLPSIHSVIEDQPPKDMQILTKNKTSQAFYLEADAQSNYQEQPQSQIILCDQDGANSTNLNENSQSVADKITQQHHRFNVLKKQPSKDMVNFQSPEKSKAKQESISKIVQKNQDQVVNFDVKSSIQVLIEDNEFDLLHGRLDKYENFQYYFPKQNVKNIINQLNPSIRQSQTKKKKTVLQQFRDSQLYSKLSKSLYQLLKERDIGSCRTITRSKAREGSGTEKKIVIRSQKSFSANKDNTRIQRGRKKMSLNEDLTDRNEQLDDSFLNSSKNYNLFRYQSARQLQNDDPQTPPQNENEIHLVEIASMVMKKQNQYFSSLDTSNFQYHQNYN
ncbi:hypothetical protein ABPG72_010865 [Tetrahymena utriculariae]